MMNILFVKKYYLLLLVAILVITGCVSTSPNAQFYMLTPLQPAVAMNAASSFADKYIIIGPINFPKYLDRPHIVTRTANTEIYLSDIHRWAEPVESNFTRVFAENLSQLLGSERISIAPSRDRALADYRITMEVLRFDASRDGRVMLTAYWNIYTKDATNPLATRKSEYSLNASQNAGYAELVDVMSTSIAQLSREIADIIQKY